MALDHYVSQVHLKRFYASALNDLMYATRKSDLKRFTPRSNDVCRIDEGNTNDYLIEPRAIEEFLKTIEGKYNASAQTLEEGEPDREAIYSIAGFAAYVLTCSPAAMRINSGPLREMVAQVGKKLEALGGVPPPPEILGGKNLTDLLDKGVVKIKIDPKYPQAVGIANILQRVAWFGNCHWEILRNEESDCRFFTSDFPIGNEASLDPRVLNRVLPLTPGLAVRIQPNLAVDRATVNFDFKHFSYKRRFVRRQEAISINRLLVQSAEDTVLFCEDQRWVAKFIEKNRHFRVDTEIVKNAALPQGALHFRQAIVTFHHG
jgi:hypothetical protein